MRSRTPTHADISTPERASMCSDPRGTRCLMQPMVKRTSSPRPATGARMRGDSSSTGWASGDAIQIDSNRKGPPGTQARPVCRRPAHGTGGIPRPEPAIPQSGCGAEGVGKTPASPRHPPAFQGSAPPEKRACPLWIPPTITPSTTFAPLIAFVSRISGSTRDANSPGSAKM